MASDVSFLIPARCEKYLEQTVRNVLDNIRGDSEVLVCLDGWIPDPQIIFNDPRVKFFHKETSIGQRAAINFLAREAQGKYICKLDAHCAIDEGMDVKLMADCEYDWTVIPRMWNLDVDTFKPRYFNDFDKALRHGKVHDYLYIYVNERGELRTQYYPSHINKEMHRAKKDILIDETMSCMGPGFFMHKDRFFETGWCDENHEGGWGQQAVEVACKAWLSGGKLMVNKKTWFAHWFRGHLGWPYPITGNQIDRVRKYSTDLWLNNKWEKQTRPFSWLIEKFSPVPGWDKTAVDNMKKDDAKKFPAISLAQSDSDDEANFGAYPTYDEKMFIFKKMYWHIIKRSNFIRWRGHVVLKFPSDLMLYQRMIRDYKPDFIIETGTFNGGSALFFADMCELNGKGNVITIDKVMKSGRPDHPRISYITGSSTDAFVMQEIKKKIGDGKVMVILDSDHHFNHVKAELDTFAPLVTKGQFMVLEDCYGKFGEEDEAFQARDKFLESNKDFELTEYHDRFLVGITMGGWLLKK